MAVAVMGTTSEQNTGSPGNLLDSVRYRNRRFLGNKEKGEKHFLNLILLVSSFLFFLLLLLLTPTF